MKIIKKDKAWGRTISFIIVVKISFFYGKLTKNARIYINGEEANNKKVILNYLNKIYYAKGKRL